MSSASISGNRELREYVRAMNLGALKGASVGGLASVGAYRLLRNKISTHLRSGLALFLICVSPAAFGAFTRAEIDGHRFGISKRSSAQGIEPVNSASSSNHSTSAISDFLCAHKHKLVVAGWAASFAGCLHLINRNGIFSKAQKIVQARVLAQGITLLLLMPALLLSPSALKSKEEQLAKLRAEAPNSWEYHLPRIQQTNHSK